MDNISFWAAMILAKLYNDSGDRKSSALLTTIAILIFALELIKMFVK